MALDANLVTRLVAKVKLNVGRSGDTTLDDYVIEYINNGQRKVANKANFWFLRASTTLPITAGVNTIALPADFKDEDIVSLQVTTGSNVTWTDLDYSEWDEVRRFESNTQRSQPNLYIVDNRNIILFPIPKDDGTLQLDYWKFPADMVAGGTPSNLLLDYPDILEAYANYKAFARLREFDEASAWKTIFQQELQDLVVANAQRELPDEFVLQARPDVNGRRGRRIRGR